MKPNSSKPKTVGVPSNASSAQAVSMAHGHHHHQLYQQQQQQPSSLGNYQQMMQLPAGTSYPQHQQQHQPGMPPGVIVLPSAPTAPMSYGQQQQQQRHKANGLDQAADKMYQLSIGGGFPAVSAGGQPAVGYHHQQQQQQPMMMMMAPQQQYHPSSQSSAMDFAGCQQLRPYSSQFQQTPDRLMPNSFPNSQFSPQQSQQAFPSAQQPDSTTEAQYFLDPNCTVPMKQLPTSQPPVRSRCSDPKCTNCKPR